MRHSRIVVALLAASALGLTGSAIARTHGMAEGDGSQQVTDTSDGVRQGYRERDQAAQGAARRDRRQRDAAVVDDSETAGSRRTDGSRRYADWRNGDGGQADRRRFDDRQSEDRQARWDRRQDWAGRSEAGRHARWRDPRDHRDFNRRDFGHDRGERRGVAHGGRWYGERPRTNHRGFDDRVDRRLDNLRARTRSGWKDGEVTHRELERLRHDQRKIARMDRRFGSDGHYTKHERRKLNKALDRASQRVYRAKHNDRVAQNDRRHRW